MKVDLLPTDLFDEGGFLPTEKLKIKRKNLYSNEVHFVFSEDLGKAYIFKAKL